MGLRIFFSVCLHAGFDFHCFVHARIFSCVSSPGKVSTRPGAYEPPAWALLLGLYLLGVIERHIRSIVALRATCQVLAHQYASTLVTQQDPFRDLTQKIFYRPHSKMGSEATSLRPTTFTHLADGLRWFRGAEHQDHLSVGGELASASYLFEP